MAKITYTSGNQRQIDKIKPLWNELNKHHLSVSPYFKEYYQNLTFEDRKRVILQRALGGAVRVDFALDESGALVGYCVSSIDKLQMGEVDSIYVSPKFRGQGIGKELMTKALIWLDELGAKKKIVSVAVGNEQSYGFYAKFGFLPRRSMLEQKKQ
jgi:diamine N-acetyltransferase